MEEALGAEGIVVIEMKLVKIEKNALRLLRLRKRGEWVVEKACGGPKDTLS